ncbi:MAG: hypothetical protein QXV17_09570 [Candidatus Micrarchaeaceae archaeon]
MTNPYQFFSDKQIKQIKQTLDNLRSLVPDIVIAVLLLLVLIIFKILNSLRPTRFLHSVSILFFTQPIIFIAIAGGVLVTLASIYFSERIIEENSIKTVSNFGIIVVLNNFIIIPFLILYGIYFFLISNTGPITFISNHLFAIIIFIFLIAYQYILQHRSSKKLKSFYIYENLKDYIDVNGFLQGISTFVLIFIGFVALSYFSGLIAYFAASWLLLTCLIFILSENSYSKKPYMEFEMLDGTTLKGFLTHIKEHGSIVSIVTKNGNFLLPTESIKSMKELESPD